MSFSIITTVLNGKKHIESCLDSVAKQNYNNNAEHIIVDGGSKDKTIEIVNNYVKKFKNIKFFSKNKINIYEGINIGISESNNEIIGILHSDDFYNSKDIFSEIDKIFKNNKEIDAVYTNVDIYHREKPEKIYRKFKSMQLLPIDYLKCNHPPHTSLFIKKKFLIYMVFIMKIYQLRLTLNLC